MQTFQRQQPRVAYVIWALLTAMLIWGGSCALERWTRAIRTAQDVVVK